MMRPPRFHQSVLSSTFTLSGTIAAILTTSVVYISSVFFYAGSVEGALARDKFGLSVRKKLVIANLAWPNEWVILVGSLLSTVGAGLQVRGPWRAGGCRIILHLFFKPTGPTRLRLSLNCR